MPNVCRACGNQFPFGMVIDGKKRSLNHRRYCLDCLPFGDRGAARGVAHSVTFTCVICNRDHTYTRKYRSKMPTVCPSCKVNRRRFEVKIRAINYKGRVCVIEVERLRKPRLR